MKPFLRNLLILFLQTQVCPTKLADFLDQQYTVIDDIVEVFLGHGVAVTEIESFTPDKSYTAILIDPKTFQRIDTDNGYLAQFTSVTTYDRLQDIDIYPITVETAAKTVVSHKDIKTISKNTLEIDLGPAIPGTINVYNNGLGLVLKAGGAGMEMRKIFVCGALVNDGTEQSVRIAIIHNLQGEITQATFILENDITFHSEAFAKQPIRIDGLTISFDDKSSMSINEAYPRFLDPSIIYRGFVEKNPDSDSFYSYALACEMNIKSILDKSNNLDELSHELEKLPPQGRYVD